MNYKKQLVRFKLTTIVNLSFIMFMVSFIISGLINLLATNNQLLLTGKVYWDIIITLAMLALLLAIHELLHALGGLLSGGCTVKDISFGINLKQSMLYCHINKPIKVGIYRFVLLLPVIVTGIIPLIICTLYGNIFMVFLFSIMVSGGAGDVIMFFSLAGYDKNVMVLDHASAPAYYLLYEEGKTPQNFVECTEADENKLLDDMKKSPCGTTDGKNKNLLIKSLLIAIFCALTVLGIFVTALIMAFC